jgi:hypothetical protein
MVKRGVILVVSVAHLGGCILPSGRSDVGGIAAVELESVGPDGYRQIVRLRGPARFRRSSSTSVAVAARFLRSTSAGLRRGDLLLSWRLPSPRTDFYGEPPTFTATYAEASPGQSRPDVYDGSGRIRVDLRPGGVRVALELEFAARQAAGSALASFKLRGILASGYDLDGGYVTVYDLGYGIWYDPFDPYLAWEDPDYDYDFYVIDGGYDATWATEPSYWEVDPGYGGVDVYDWTTDPGYDWSGWDSGYDSGGGDWGGGDWGGGDWGGGDWGGGDE